MGYYYYNRSRAQQAAIWGGVSYLLRDEFTSALAAGSVNGTAAEPGPGTRAVTDANSKLSITGGALSVATGGAAANEPRLSYGSIARATGRLLIASTTVTTEGAIIALSDVNTAARQAAIRLYDTSIAIDKGAASWVVVGAYSTATAYQVAIVERAAGEYVFIKGGAFTNWELLWSDANGASDPLYVIVGADDTASVYTADYLRIPDVLWLPSPICFDSFTRANGAIGDSETSGPDSQAVTARTWTGATFTVASNVAVGTPTAGATLWDADAAVFTAGTYSWAVYGTNTIANDANSLKTTWVSHAAGSYCWLRDTADLSANLTVGTWYMFNVDAKVGAGDSVNLEVYDGAAYLAGPAITGTSFVTQVITILAGSATGCLVRSNNMGAGEDIWLDNLSLKPLTLSTLFASVDDAATADVVASVDVICTAGTQAGLVVNLDSAASPANFVIAYVDGVNCKLEKCVSGVYSSIISGAVTYGAGKTLRVIKDGTSYTLYYNNAKIGATSTISDAGIVDNTKHGLFSTHASNTLNNFELFPRGDGAYSDLDAW